MIENHGTVQVRPVVQARADLRAHYARKGITVSDEELCEHAIALSLFRALTPEAQDTAIELAKMMLVAQERREGK